MVFVESKPVMYEMHFLRDIAEQNYSKYNIESPGKERRGLTLSVFSLQSVGLAVARFFNILDESSLFHMMPGITLPTWDEISKGMIFFSNNYPKVGVWKAVHFLK